MIHPVQKYLKHSLSPWFFISFHLNVLYLESAAGDSLGYHNNMKFSTHDKDNDPDSRNCANDFDGGWWFKECVESNLNGLYYHTNRTDRNGKGICWKKWKEWNSLKKSEMKLRLS